MKAIIVMFDSLRRDALGTYGGRVPTPNFDRLAEHCVTFDKNYVGSLPCMPARRELHTGRYNFLHRSWGPLEPFDDSMPQILKDHGIHTHLSTDHYHYAEDGGATYHTRFNTYSIFRGQESDGWIADLGPHPTEYSPNIIGSQNMYGTLAELRKKGGWQNEANRTAMQKEEDYSLYKTFENGIDFLDRNHRYDNWFLQIEAFDPHEPFTSPDSFQSRYFSPDEGFVPDWPPYAKVDEDEKLIEGVRKKYRALVEFCDKQMGRVLDKMDEYSLWDDTMLIVNTDHGFFLADHGYWGKGNTPNYEVLVHTPLFVYDPRSKIRNERRSMLTQSIDIPVTILSYFGIDIPEDMMGKDLCKAVNGQKTLRDTAIFGYHGSPIGITDGKYVLLRAIQDMSVPVYEYTQMPTHMRGRFSVEEMKTMTVREPFSFTKDTPVMKIDAVVNPRFLHAQEEGEDELYDLENDPTQEHPLDLPEAKERLLRELKKQLKANDAPEELYARYKL